ncbi:hypothetical protein SteCoe_8335 [Stentor coeruleus]|uniref:Uncharacterized protein n=1 Tax=Stentor coeruleus TaxID=5963 RepID=A0A1R2CKQ8_9CILI|nr:hypothetical protein SteCoe_8335 [Stentor coeruleus]
MQRRMTKVKTNVEEDVKVKKMIEGMLAKSENVWNKLLPEHKEILNATCLVDLFSIQEEDFQKKKSSPSFGFGINDLLVDEPSFNQGKILINAADPYHLHWSLSLEDRHKINLSKLYANFSGQAENAMKEKSIISDSKEEDDFPKTENILSRLSIFKSKLPSIKDLTKDQGKDQKTQFESNVFEGDNAKERLNVAGITEIDVNAECLLLIVHDGTYLFIKFEDPKFANIWIASFKLLLKAQQSSYRGTKDEYPGVKREWIKDISRDKEVRLEHKDRKYLIWILDPEVDSKLYRELKLMYWSKNGEINHFVIIDMRKTFNEITEAFKTVIDGFTNCILSRMIAMQYMNFFEISRYYMMLMSDFDNSSEIKGMSFYKDKQDKEPNERYYGLNSDGTFWDHRRKILKRYQLIKKEEVKSKVEKISKIHEDLLYSLDASDNKVLRALKIVQLQKQELRNLLSSISYISYKRRGKQGGRRAQKREAYEQVKKERNVVKATASVLKLLMFEETRPDLIPDNLRNKMTTEEDKRDGCCDIS